MRRPLLSCGRCNRLQPVSEFTKLKRTCAKALAGHNARRRARYVSRAGGSVRAAAGADEGGGASADAEADDAEAWQALSGELLLRGADSAGGSNTPACDESASADDASGFLSFLEDYLPASLEPERQPQPQLAPLPSGLMPSAYAYPPPALHGARLSLKLLHDAPLALPWDGLRPAALAAFAACGEEALAMEACIAPGCTLLQLDAVLLTHPRGCAAHEALARMLAAPGAAGAFLRSSGRALRLTDTRGRCASALGGVVAAQEEAAPPEATQQLPPLSPLAALCSAPVAVSLPRGAALPASLASWALRCALHGQALRVDPGDAHALAVLPAAGVEGAALLFAADAASGELLSRRPAVLLLAHDAAIVAEIAATEAQLGGDAEARARVQAALLSLGHALRAGCAPPLAACAAASALALGWRAAASRVLAAHSGHDADALLLPGGATLLHAAAHTGNAWAVRLVLAAGGASVVFGAPHSVCGTPARATPLHAAAAAGSVDALAALTEASPRAVVAFCHARCAQGRTPSAVARAGTANAALLALDARLRERMRAGSRVLAAARQLLHATHGICLPHDQAAMGPSLLREPAFLAAVSAHASADAIALAAAAFAAAADAYAVAPEPLPMPLHLVAAVSAHGGGALSEAQEFQLFAEQQAAASVHVMIGFVALALSHEAVGAIKRHGLRGAPPLSAAEVAAAAAAGMQLTVNQMFRAVYLERSWGFLPATLALLALLLAPSRRLRTFYVHHQTVLLSAYWLAVFVVTPLIMAIFLVERYPDGLTLPRWNNVAHFFLTFCSALMPMRARPLCGLLALRAVGCCLGAARWPIGAPLDAAGWLTQPRTNAALSVALAPWLLAQERRLFRGWRAARAAGAKAAKLE
jgi:hypothetical protein